MHLIEQLESRLHLSTTAVQDFAQPAELLSQNPAATVVVNNILIAPMPVEIDHGILRLGPGGEDNLTITNFHGTLQISRQFRGSFDTVYLIALADASLVTGIEIHMGSGSSSVHLDVNIPATVYGGLGDDTIYGSSADDVIYGGAGNDQIYGRDGNDQIYGLAGDDTLFGGSGNDFITLGEGVRQEGHGGLGDDTVAVGAYAEASFLYGGAGSDLLYGAFGLGDVIPTKVSASDIIPQVQGLPLVVLLGGSGDDTMWLTGGRAITFTAYGESGQDSITLSDCSNAWVDAGTDNDSITAFEVDFSTIRGGDGNDEISSYSSTNTEFFGNHGNDHIVAYGASCASIHGGLGDDLIETIGPGTCTVFGGDGNDILNNDLGSNAMIYGGLGDDTIFLRDTASYARGDAGADTFYIGLGGQDPLDSDPADTVIHLLI